MLARLTEKLLPFLNEPVNGGIEANAHVDSDALEIVAAAMPILKWVVDIPTMDVRTAIVMGHDVREHFPRDIFEEGVACARVCTAIILLSSRSLVILLLCLSHCSHFY